MNNSTNTKRSTRKQARAHYMASWKASRERLVRVQWVHGVEPIHRLCCRPSSEEIEQRRAKKEKPKFSGLYVSSKNPCGSNTCSPGDPWGCSMRADRIHAAKTSMLFECWSGSGEMIVTTLDTIGRPGERLHDVLKRDARAFIKVVSGSAWVKDKREAGIGGHVWASSVVRLSNRRWLVRRWLVLALTEDSARPDDWDTRLRSRWASAHSVESGGGQFQKWLGIDGEFEAHARYICGASNEFEPVTGWVWESLDMAFPLPADARRPWHYGLLDQGNAEYIRDVSHRRMWSCSTGASDHPVWRQCVKSDSFNALKNSVRRSPGEPPAINLKKGPLQTSSHGPLLAKA